MRIAAYQFSVTADIETNLNIMLAAIERASHKGIRLLVMPEYALSGSPFYAGASLYPIDKERLASSILRLQRAAQKNDLYLVAGSTIQAKACEYNAALFFTPEGTEPQYYIKRALWGEEMGYFRKENTPGVFMVDDLKVGVRICYEIRFPGFFAELYKERTDLNLVLFHDVSGMQDGQRYALQRSHLLTRACENIVQTLSVNTCERWQCAPTAFYNHEGSLVKELNRHRPGFLTVDFERPLASLSSIGRRNVIREWEESRFD